MDLNQIALGVILVWIVIVIFLFMFLLKKYTFGDWTPEKPNPYQGETLAMPRGIFRGILTLSILFIVMVLEVSSLAFDPKDLEVSGQIFIPEDRFREMMVAFQMVIAFYFGSKVMHHMTSAERTIAKTKAEAEVIKSEKQAITPGPPVFGEEGARG